MSKELKLALLIITIIYLFIIFKSIKNKKMQISFSIFWIFTGVVLIMALIIPNFIENISSFLGFLTTANMIFCIAIFMVFYLIFNLTISLSKENKKNTRLIQEISILNKKIDDLKSNEIK